MSPPDLSVVLLGPAYCAHSEKRISGDYPNYPTDLLSPGVLNINPLYSRPQRIIPPHKTDICQKSFISSATYFMELYLGKKTKKKPLLVILNNIFPSVILLFLPAVNIMKEKRKHQITHCRLCLEMRTRLHL